MYCNGCGAQVAEGAAFCVNCGCAVNADPENGALGQVAGWANYPTASAAAIERDGNRKVTMPVVVGAVIAVIAVLVILAVSVTFSRMGVVGGEQNGGVFSFVQQIQQPRTLEEWVNARNPSFPSDYRNQILTNPLCNGGFADIAVDVEGNSVVVKYYVNDDAEDGGLFDSLIIMGSSEIGSKYLGGEDRIVSFIKQSQQNTGISPITLIAEWRYKDGPLVYTASFDETGRTDDNWLESLF